MVTFDREQSFPLQLFAKHFGTPTARKNAPAFAITWGASLIIGLFLKQRASDKFAHWPCPRCHSEWPGTNIEKDPACRACGLRLRQLSP